MKALRVLVIEDEMLIGMLLADILGATGYGICAVAAAEPSAVAAVARDRPDLMIIDARLHDGSSIATDEGTLCTSWVSHVSINGKTSNAHAVRPGAIVIQRLIRDSDLDRTI